jgi:hypothetical protein
MIPEFLARLYANSADVLGWKWVPDDHLIDTSQTVTPPQAPFAAKQDYVVLRVAEMYLQKTRRLWREYYPVVHTFVAYGDPAAQRTVAGIAGPGQLKDLGTENLDRLVGLAYRIAGPIVYDGQDIEMLAGLYAVPAKDGAKVILDTLGQLSSLTPTIKQAVELANIFKGGIEGLLGLSGTTLALGIRDALRTPGAGIGRTARPGFLVAFNAPASSINEQELWIKGGRLCQGPNPIAATEFKSTDAMLFELHRGPSRAPGWARLPELATHAESFDTALRETSSDELPKRINDLYRRFEAQLASSEELTDPDKGIIRGQVADELLMRVKKIRGGGLIEEKSMTPQQTINVRSFRPSEFLDIPAGVELISRPEGVPVFSRPLS